MREAFDGSLGVSFLGFAIAFMVAAILGGVLLTLRGVRLAVSFAAGSLAISTRSAWAVYRPSGVAVVAIGCLCLVVVPLAWRASRMSSRRGGWLLVIAAVLTSLWIVDTEPAGVRMIAIITVLLLATKGLSHGGLTFRQWLAFSAWFGMRPAIFSSLGTRDCADSRLMLSRGIRNLAAGALFVVAARMVVLTTPQQWSRVLATPLLLVGLSLILHFGVLNFVGALWRAHGVPAERLFRDPLRASSPADFWRRWNLGFTQMTSLAIYGPVKSVAGRRVAIFCSFLISGLLHELAISVPVRAGYGLPTAYFALQGLLVLWNPKSRVITMAGLLLPVLLVFHPPFLAALLWPLIGLS